MGEFAVKLKRRWGFPLFFLVLFSLIGRNVGLIVSHANPEATAVSAGIIVAVFSGLFGIGGCSFGYYLVSVIDNLNLSRVKRISLKVFLGFFALMFYFLMMGLTSRGFLIKLSIGDISKTTLPQVLKSLKRYYRCQGF